MSLNHIVIMGRLTRDPEMRYTNNDTAVASFTLAVDRDVKDKSGERPVDFIDCVAWRATAKFVSDYFKKGSMAAVSGRLQFREWNDKEGNKRRVSEVLAESVYFGESKKSDSDSTYRAPRGVNVDASSFGDLDDVSANPFSDLSDADGELPF